METLDQILKYYSEHYKEYQYYKSMQLDLSGVLESSDEAYDFIKEYFGIGGKENLFLKIPRQYERDVKERAIHIVSTFFLGLKIAECMGIDTMKRNEESVSFLYLWFLSCLYHDIGYCFENHSRCDDLRSLSVDGLEAVQGIADIQYLHNRVFKTYPRGNVDLYLKGRATCRNGQRGVIDHGIVGGLLLYDGLRKQFEKWWENRIEINASREYFQIMHLGRELYCSNRHYKEYAKAADAIIAHNIWVDTLNEFLEKAGKPVKKRRIKKTNRLCFILSIADTIEPLKRNADKGSVFFSFARSQIVISAEKNILKNFGEPLRGLEEWLDVSVNILPDSAAIYIP